MEVFNKNPLVPLIEENYDVDKTTNTPRRTFWASSRVCPSGRTKARTFLVTSSLRLSGGRADNAFYDNGCESLAQFALLQLGMYTSSAATRILCTGAYLLLRACTLALHAVIAQEIRESLSSDASDTQAART